MPFARQLRRAVAVGAVSAMLLTAAPVAADPTDAHSPPSPTAPCDAISPVAFPCVAIGKFGDAVNAECRRVGIPDKLCRFPLAPRVTGAARDAYVRSWVHRTAQFQYELGDPLPLRQAQWIGTHNSFNSPSDGLTISHIDSNQQLTLPQQLDIDVRSLELDLHYIGRLARLGAPGVTVCHGLSAQNNNLGCTNEPLLTKVLPQIANWLNAPGHTQEVILLYLEDGLDNSEAYASTVSALDHALRRPDGSSLIFRPDPSRRAANGCVQLPPDLSRHDVRASGAQIVIVGSCAPDWSSAVFNWGGVEVESGSTSRYQSYPTCDAVYSPAVYATHLVRYFEDSTLVSALVDPNRPPANPDALTPQKAQDMTRCGVNLFGFDQLLPEDGRIQASLWSWAPNEPRGGAGSCALQGADGRWVAARCSDPHRAGCVDTAGNWTVTPSPVPFAAAPAACTAIGAQFGLPRTGVQNSRLRAAAETAGDAWVQYTIA
jgi:hypothetical protein